MKSLRKIKSEKYIDKNFRPIVEKSLSIASICRKLDIRPTGGNYKTIQYYIDIYNISTEHFTGQGWNVGDMYRPVRVPLKFEDILIENSTYTNSTSLRKRLINNKLLINKCYECGITEWNGKKLTLQLDHINGNNRDNRIENLRLLCPNCHSQTPTYCNRYKINQKEEYKIRKYKENDKELKTKEIKKYYCECGNEKSRKSKHCINCSKEKQRKVERPPYKQLKKEIEETNYTQVGRKYGVSDNTIRKWIRKYENNL